MGNYQKRHYHHIAGVVKKNYEKQTETAARNAIKDIAVDFHHAFRDDSARYSPSRFLTECGIDDWEDITCVMDSDLEPYKLKHNDGTWYGTKQFLDYDNGRIED